MSERRLPRRSGKESLNPPLKCRRRWRVEGWRAEKADPAEPAPERAGHPTARGGWRSVPTRGLCYGRVLGHFGLDDNPDFLMVNKPRNTPPLSPAELEAYEWQFAVTGFGEPGQEKLKAASVLISRCGGLGGVVAYELAAAGVGRLVLAHAGNVKPGDLNRQLLMSHASIGKSRVECAARKLRELNPHIEIVAIPENVTSANAPRLVEQADLVVDCAPLFEERFLLNHEAVRQGKPMIECAVFELEGHLTTIVPGQTPCLRCLYPEPSPTWTRRFPVFGAVSGAVGCLAAMEVIKVLANLGRPLRGKMLTFDLRDMSFRNYRVRRDPRCAECGSVAPRTPAAGG